MNNKITVLFVVLFTAIVAVFSFNINNVDASPLMVDPTPTAFITYWLGDSETYTAVAGGSGTAWELPAGGYISDLDSDGANDFVVPDDQQIAGVLIRLNSVNYTGDNNLVSGTNTNWFQKFNDNWTAGADEMTPGEWTCNGSTAGCSGVGFSVESAHDWEGFGTYNGTDYLPSVRVYHQLGGAGATTNFTIQPIFYGAWECTSITPSTREFISSGLLLGPDPEGETFQLSPGKEYVLMTNAGPWNDGVDNRYDVAVRFKSSHTVDPPSGAWGEWTAIDSVPGQDVCNDDFLDANGAVLAFTTASYGDEDYGTQSQIQFRVNDVDDEFDDNSGDIEYFWLGEEGSSQGCEDTWTVGSKVASNTLTATNASMVYLSDGYAGGRFNGLVAPSQSYLYKVTGTFQDNGSPSNETFVLAGPSGTYWDDPASAFISSSQDYCDDETDSALYYYGTTKTSWAGYSTQAGQQPISIIEDGNSNYGDNSGDVLAEWYEGTWSAPQSDCATKYSRGTFIESPIFFADQEDGRQYPQATNGFVVGQVYYLESQGQPYYLDGSPSWDFEVANTAYYDNDWQDPEQFFDCITQIDQNRYGYYWTATQENIKLRAEFALAGHDANTGTVKFNLYGAIPNEVPAGESCSDYYEMETLRWRGTMDADETAGVAIDHSVFTPGNRYAIIITGQYTDPVGTGKTGEIRRSAPGIGAVDWDDMASWIPALCYEQIDGFDVVYFEAETLSDYEVRATSPIGNTGTMSFEVYELEQIKETVLGCEYNYSSVDAWYVLKQNETINANNEGVEYDGDGNISAVTGFVMANEFTQDSRRYKIETGYLNNEYGPPQWDLQISTDGGATWIFLQDWADCWVDLGTPEGRGYFTSPVDGGPFLLRVYDVGGIYWNNTGGVNFSMWIDSSNADPGDVWTNPYSPSSWGIGCTAQCPRPGFLQVGEWVEYARCRLTSWLAWCPEHSKDLSDMQSAFSDVEPFRTIFEMISLGRLIREEIGSYSWNDDQGGGANDYQFTAPQNFIFMPDDGGGGGVDPGALTGPLSIWGTGSIDLTPDDSVNYRTVCDTELTESLGTRLGQPMCFAFNVLDQLGLRSWFQMFWDTFLVIGFFMYIKKSWVDKMQ